MNTLVCPFCEAGHLGNCVFSDSFDFKEGTVFVEGLLGHRCDKCEEVMIYSEDIRHNDRLIREAKASQTGD